MIDHRITNKSTRSNYPKFDPANLVVFSGPGYALLGGINENGRSYTADDEPAASHHSYTVHNANALVGVLTQNDVLLKYMSSR